MKKRKSRSQKQNIDKTPAINLSPQKKRIFMIIMLSLPVLFILLLELGLRIGSYGEDLRLFVSTPDESSQYLGMNLRVAQRYYYYYGEQFDPKPTKDLFLKEKPENGYRIFVLGASTTAGFPYGNNISFARVLHRRLVDTFPDRTVEVINTAITSVNTYTLLDFMDEILEQDPDALLIYAGHNEYYGPFGPSGKITLGKYPFIARMILKLQNYKTFLLLRDFISAGLRTIKRQKALSATSIKNSQEIDATFLNKTIIPVDSREYRIGVQQYRDNLDAILKKAKKANVPVLISEVICNIRDQRPFPTMQADSLSEAFQLFTEARALEQNAQFDAARQKYYKAKDLDPIRFRAPEIFNDIIHELGSKYNAPIIPMKKYFKDVSPNGLIANNIILDHVHPDLTGYFLMADAFYQTMREHKHIRENWPKIADVPTLSYLSNWGFTPLDSLYAQLVLMNLTSGWPFTTENFSSISARQSIINRFKLETKLDSIALRTYTDTGYNIQTAHLDLAKYYKRNGEFKLAFAEYKALIYSIPSIDVFYELAVELLVKMKQYQHAQQILTDALKYHRSAFIYKWLGQLNLINNQIKDGIIYLKTSQAFEPNDDQVLFNLTRAYYTIFEFENGDTILKQLSKESGSDRSVKRLSAFRKSQQSRLTKASTHLKEARGAFIEKQNAKAVTSLQRSLKITEIGLAYEMLGIIMMMENKTEQAIPFLRKAIQLRSEEKPELLYNLTLAYVNMKQIDSATDTFLHLQKAAPDHQNIDQLGQRIAELNDEM